jgi:hypothetical protein
MTATPLLAVLNAAASPVVALLGLQRVRNCRGLRPIGECEMCLFIV